MKRPKCKKINEVIFHQLLKEVERYPLSPLPHCPCTRGCQICIRKIYFELMEQTHSRRHTLVRASYQTKKGKPNVRTCDLMCKKLYDITKVACES